MLPLRHRLSQSHILLPPLIALILDPATGKVHDKVALLPTHVFGADGVGVECALADEAEVFHHSVVFQD